ncbi:DUF2845 domain-containing protein [Jeongeupia sp. USM3]|uniref:DUF2845 domain-containing protein n=1 Tax=Jeongeupia sp. USM3 TaxID=1906741 RepID=UPI00089DF19A|nr:DUF2845 domain-containing protein [Jeongeupia sp. USM3]AOX99550.1 hypothetical protein BJP62_03215 [Jeongeupia sp. USM3]
MNVSTLALLALGLCSTAATAASFRCNNDLVYVGDSRATVLQKCGEPMVKDSFCKAPPQTVSTGGQGTVVNVVPCENVDEWTYNPGSGKFLTTLRFERGTLAGIRDGDRAK